MLSSVPTSIREISAEDISVTFPVIHQLRAHLDVDDFQRRVAKQRRSGYMLYGAFDGRGVLLGAIGMRPVMTLARGSHLHVDDLVVDEKVRGTGIGKTLLEFAERWASENALQAVFLDSRYEVIGFYSRHGYKPHSASLMRKRITSEPTNPGAET